MNSPKPPCYTIYCHTHIESGRRYIGLTKLTMMKRWNQHLANAKAKQGKGCAHFWAAIRKYGKDAFSHEVLEVCGSLEEANAAEQKWIEHFKTRDPEFGFNLAKGGDHTPHPFKNPWDRPEYRARMGPVTEKLIAAGTSPETLAKMTATHRSPEFRAKRSAISKKFQSDPDYRVRQSVIAQKTHSDPEVKAKLSAAGRGRQAKPISQETRDKLRAAGTGRKPTDEIRAKMAHKSRPVTQAGVVVGLQCSTHGFVGVDHCRITTWSSGNLRVVCRLCANEADKRRKDNNRRRRGLPVVE